jgi:sugar phosphate isomerase/epimerase
MDYGIKIEPKRMAADDWRSAFGSIPPLARAARSAGAAFIELRWDETTPSDLLLSAACQIAAEGLWVSVHPYLWNLGLEAFTEPTHAAGLAAVFDLAEEVSGITGHVVPLIFHGGHVRMTPHDVEYSMAMARSREYFAWAATELRIRPHVMAVSEAQLPFAPGEELRHRIGQTYEECIETVRGTGLGLCWDFGHTYLGARFGRHATEPPPEFLRLVRHVHAHDVIEKDGGVLDDHRPLGTGIAPWRENLRRLAAVNYRGGILLEIDLVPFGSADAVAAMLRRVLAEMDAQFDAAQS